ncbi:hypothetical protein Dsin_001262 [Dipteronia sinensis]|uniref:Peptidase A2 domain-containing protein n=1 Tax=Dipteronia sinensis TaxID=43782 RepID=A0AAE0B420_9ROSI|nr:hypothetical protein Dsin_001262 [Dipteronia sinensis]
MDETISLSKVEDIEQMVKKITSTDKLDSYNYDRYYHNTKPYYPRPTPPDLKYEETVSYRAYTAIDHTSDSDTTSSLCLSDRYPEKQPCICKEINVLDQHDYTMIIGMIDSIEDPSLKAKYLRELQQNISSGRTQQPIISSPPTSFPFSTPDFDSNVIGRFQTKTKKITISDLQKEIQNLKNEIKIIKTTISKLEHPSSVTKNDHRTPLQKNPSFASSSDSDDPNIADQPSLTTVLNHPRSPSHLSQIKTYKIQKWYIEIDIRISQDYNLIVNALVDTGADLNCIMEALVPTKYLEKTTESLFGANKQQLDIQYKLANAKVCNQGVCYTTDFVMVKTLSQNVILGLPFLHLISPFKVTSKFSLTWILMLEYAIMDKLIGNINVPYFGRQTKIKWWSGMNIADLGTQRVASRFNENPTLCKTLIDQSLFLMAKSQSRAQLAAASSRLATASTPNELRLISKDMNKAKSTISSQMETGFNGKDDRDFSDEDDPTSVFKFLLCNLSSPTGGSGFSDCLNWALARKGVVMKDKAFQNLTSSELQQKGATIAGSLSGLPIHVRGNVLRGSSDFSKAQYIKLLRQVTTHMSSIPNVFVHDGGVGSSSDSDAKVRVISDSPSAVLKLSSILWRTPTRAVSHDSCPLTLYVATSISLGVVDDNGFIAADIERSSLILYCKAFSDANGIKEALTS